MSPKMSLSAELGYFAATEEPTGWDDEFGWEIGIGMGYKLMDNLSYNAHFSYLWTGDFFTEGNSLQTEDIYLLAHALSMKF
jgi:opacity protein-like surface antigen